MRLLAFENRLSGILSQTFKGLVFGPAFFWARKIHAPTAPKGGGGKNHKPLWMADSSSLTRHPSF
jgi:hypothetical protein